MDFYENLITGLLLKILSDQKEILEHQLEQYGLDEDGIADLAAINRVIQYNSVPVID